MSQIAIAHGATIDKYVGDAIVIFFGDPETRGVKEDALACVTMAMAMRKRMKELEGAARGDRAVAGFSQTPLEMADISVAILASWMAAGGTMLPSNRCRREVDFRKIMGSA